MASDFGMSRAALAQTLGLEPDQFYTAPGTPAEAGHRMRDFLAIIGKIEPWAGSPQKAIDWYRNQPIPSLGNLTAEALVRQDQGALVHSYLEDYAAGAFA